MANSLKCDLCGKPATVHLTQIVNNKMHKVDLCEECAQAKGVTDPSGFSLADLLLKASLNPEPQAEGVRCEQCGATQAISRSRAVSAARPATRRSRHHRAHARATCTRARSTWARCPQRALERKSLYDRLTHLEGELDEAIKAERYEDAARFRDEIHQVKQAFRAEGAVDMKIAPLFEAP
jgi:protein arginine kinase activator